MLFVAEFRQQIGQSTMTTYLNEVASDLLLAMFNWIQGMYKPAKLELRCAIENFLKALQSVDNAQIILEKSVYAIFDEAKNDRHFNNTYGEIKLRHFKNDYAVLCRVAHSAPQDINSMSAMNHLPKYDIQISNEVASLYIKILENSLGVLCAQYPSAIDKMHPDNKKDFLDCLSKSAKKEINTYLYS